MTVTFYTCLLIMCCQHTAISNVNSTFSRPRLHAASNVL